MQDVAAGLLVIAAAIYVARHVWMAARGRRSCGSCPAEKGTGELIQIAPVRKPSE